MAIHVRFVLGLVGIIIIIRQKNEEKWKRWDGLEPGQVAIFGLPPPFGVESVRPAILGAAKTLIREGTICGMVKGVSLIPNPFPIKDITFITVLAQKLNWGRRRW